MATTESRIRDVIESHRDAVNGRISHTLTCMAVSSQAACRKADAIKVLNEMRDEDDDRVHLMLAEQADIIAKQNAALAQQAETVAQQAAAMAELSSHLTSLATRFETLAATPVPPPIEKNLDRDQVRQLGIQVADLKGKVCQLAISQRGAEQAERRPSVAKSTPSEERIKKLERWTVAEIGRVIKQGTTTEVLLAWVADVLVKHVELPETARANLTVVADLAAKPLPQTRRLSQDQRIVVRKQAALRPWAVIDVPLDPIDGALRVIGGTKAGA